MSTLTQLRQADTLALVKCIPPAKMRKRRTTSRVAAGALKQVRTTPSTASDAVAPMSRAEKPAVPCAAVARSSSSRPLACTRAASQIRSAQIRSNLYRRLDRPPKLALDHRLPLDLRSIGNHRLRLDKDMSVGVGGKATGCIIAPQRSRRRGKNNACCPAYCLRIRYCARGMCQAVLVPQSCDALDAPCKRTIVNTPA